MELHPEESLSSYAWNRDQNLSPHIAETYNTTRLDFFFSLTHLGELEKHFKMRDKYVSEIPKTIKHVRVFHLEIKEKARHGGTGAWLHLAYVRPWVQYSMVQIQQEKKLRKEMLNRPK